MKILCSRFPRLAEIGHVRFSYDLDINQRKMDRTLKQYLNQEITFDEFVESYTAEIKHDLNRIFRWQELQAEDPPTVFVSSEYDDKTGIRKFLGHRSAEMTVDITGGILFEGNNGR